MTPISHAQLVDKYADIDKFDTFKSAAEDVLSSRPGYKLEKLAYDFPRYQRFIENVVQQVKEHAKTHPSEKTVLVNLPDTVSLAFHHNFSIISRELYKTYGISFQTLNSTAMPVHATVTWEQDHPTLLPRSDFYYKMQQEGKFTDCTILVGERAIPCHKLILCERSPYFNSSFNGSAFNTSSECTVPDGIQAQDVERWIKYLYTADETVAKTCETLEDLLRLHQLADYFRNEHLMSLCTREILDKITPENFEQVYQDPTLQNNPDLAKIFEVMLIRFAKPIPSM